jgi:hypothetical protein
MPTVAAETAGTVEVAWYGAPVAGVADHQAVAGKPGDPRAVPWSVEWARSTNSGAGFQQVAATGTLHTGNVCTRGVGCDFWSGERDLFDDFGIAISATTHRASIAYTSDQPQGDIYHDFTGFATEVPAAEAARQSAAGSVRAPLGGAPGVGLTNTGPSPPSAAPSAAASPVVLAAVAL